jgi:hypothetical protein
MSADNGNDGYFIEYTAVGNSVKVTAMDPVTLVEVSIIGDRKLSQRELAALAVRKLRYMIDKKS